ncbi:DoxX family membrane protein [Rhodococcus sp. NPDC003382]|uniref:DoxX family protein n=1 Tax=Rhodococcus sp. HM1 TaxID=2937759 RepID=UPI00200A30D6|nr:DoxX family protein [Rhodococcus sp. HM1]MCK8674539.1 DoxX family protein [Rhodococcus sp. HM1]
MILRRIARPMLASIFIAGGVDALRSPSGKADAAQPGLEQALAMLPNSVTERIPDNPEVLVRVNGAVQVGAGALLAVGKAPRIASLVLAGTLVPTTVAGHDFWNVEDPAKRAMQRTQFIKNVSLLGGLLIAAADTEGKPSLGWRGRRAARHAQEKVVAVLPSHHAENKDALGDGLHAVGERVRALTGDAAELAETARGQGSHLLEVAKDRAPVIAESARERGSGLAEVARERGAELLEVARERGPELAELARERGTELAELARERSAELAELARERGPELAETARGRGLRWWETAREHGTEWAHIAEEQAALRAREARALAEEARERRHHLAG